MMLTSSFYVPELPHWLFLPDIIMGAFFAQPSRTNIVAVRTSPRDRAIFICFICCSLVLTPAMSELAMRTTGVYLSITFWYFMFLFYSALGKIAAGKYVPRLSYVASFIGPA